MSQDFLAQIGVSYVPMVMTSNEPPRVAMSVVTRSRRTFSSSTTQSSLMSGCAFSNSFDSFCMMIMSPLLTVAITILVWAWAVAVARRENNPVSRMRGFSTYHSFCTG